MTTPPAPARLFVLLAREAPVGVILRRGPRDWVQMIHWDTKNDVFTLGQWFHGRVYGMNSNLSPNGEFLVYLANKYNKRQFSNDYGWEWTAISRPPYFTALALWPHWGGGGQFIDDESVHVGSPSPPHPDHPLEKLKLVPEPSPYRDLLERKGWKRIMRLEPPTVWEKHTDRITLSAQLQGRHERKGFIYKYTVVDKQKGSEFPIDQAQWADIDQRNRAVLAKEGKLCTATITDQGELALTELADFNANKPEQVQTPSWARKW